VRTHHGGAYGLILAIRPHPSGRNLVERRRQSTPRGIVCHHAPVSRSHHRVTSTIHIIRKKKADGRCIRHPPSAVARVKGKETAGLRRTHRQRRLVVICGITDGFSWHRAPRHFYRMPAAIAGDVPLGMWLAAKGAVLARTSALPTHPGAATGTRHFERRVLGPFGAATRALDRHGSLVLVPPLEVPEELPFDGSLTRGAGELRVRARPVPLLLFAEVHPDHAGFRVDGARGGDGCPNPSTDEPIAPALAGVVHAWAPSE